MKKAVNKSEERPVQAGPIGMDAREQAFRNSLSSEDRAIFDQIAAADPVPWIAHLRALGLRSAELERKLAWIERRLSSVGEDAVVHQRLREADALAFRLRAEPILARHAANKAQKRDLAIRAAKQHTENAQGHHNLARELAPSDQSKNWTASAKYVKKEAEKVARRSSDPERRAAAHKLMSLGDRAVINILRR